MKRATLIIAWALLLLVGCLGACKAKPAPKLFATAPGVPNPVNVVDGTGAGSNVLFTSGNPGVVTGGGGTITIDGGSVTANQGTAAAASGAWPVSIVNDAGNAVPVSAASLPLPTGAAQDTTLTSGAQLAQVTNDAGNPVPNDPYAGDKLNALVVQTVPATQNILVDAGTRCIRDMTFYNESTSAAGYAQIFCGQYAPDASGTANAATKPDFQIPCPAKTQCSQDLKAPLCCAGAVWYAGVDAGFLLTTSAPTLDLVEAVIR